MWELYASAFCFLIFLYFVIEHGPKYFKILNNLGTTGEDSTLVNQEKTHKVNANKQADETMGSDEIMAYEENPMEGIDADRELEMAAKNDKRKFDFNRSSDFVTMEDETKRLVKEIERNLVGKWKMVRQNNIRNVNKEKRTGIKGFILRNAPITTTSAHRMEIQVENTDVVIVFKLGGTKVTQRLPLNVPYKQEYGGVMMTCMTTWMDNILITEASPMNPEKYKARKFHRQRVDSDLIQTVWVGDVKGTQVFTPVSLSVIFSDEQCEAELSHTLASKDVDQ